MRRKIQKWLSQDNKENDDTSGTSETLGGYSGTGDFNLTDIVVDMSITRVKCVTMADEFEFEYAQAFTPYSDEEIQYYKLQDLSFYFEGNIDDIEEADIVVEKEGEPFHVVNKDHLVSVTRLSGRKADIVWSVLTEEMVRGDDLYHKFRKSVAAIARPEAQYPVNREDANLRHHSGWDVHIPDDYEIIQVKEKSLLIEDGDGRTQLLFKNVLAKETWNEFDEILHVVSE